MVVAQLGLAAVALGPSRALKLSLQAIMVASAGRTVVVLAQTLPQKVRAAADPWPHIHWLPWSNSCRSGCSWLDRL